MKTLQELENLSDEELRVMLAELDGYEKQVRADVWWHRGKGKYASSIELPNYPADLNACHAIIVNLTEPQMRRFADLVCDQYGDGTTGDMSFHSLLSMSAKTTTVFLILTLQKP